MKVGDYVRTKYGIFKIRNITKDLGYNKKEKRVIVLDRNVPEQDYKFKFYRDEPIFEKAKFTPNILDLLKPLDLMFIDISPDNCGGIVVPRIPETYCELNQILDKIKLGTSVLKGIVTKEQLKSLIYEFEGEVLNGSVKECKGLLGDL